MSHPEYVSNNITPLLSTPVEFMMHTNVTLLEKDKFVDEGLRLMEAKNTRSVLVSHHDEVIGLVSKTDILFKVIGQGKDPAKVRLHEIMTSPVVAVGPKDTVQEALAVMDKHVIRQVIVSSASSVRGMISREEIFEKMQMARMFEADSGLSGTPVCIINPKAILYMKDTSTVRITCPYCESPFDTKDALTSHIDKRHTDITLFDRHLRRIAQ